jgi:hypothetical protein
MGGTVVETFYLHVISLTDIEELERLKEELKDQVVHPDLNWQDRMELYKRVQFIMERLRYLQGEETDN